MIFAFVSVISLLVLTLFLKRPKETETPLWSAEDEELESSQTESEDLLAKLEKPTGWSDEQYRLWLESEMPDGWTLVQWVLFSDEQIKLLDQQEKQKNIDSATGEVE